MFISVDVVRQVLFIDAPVVSILQGEEIDQNEFTNLILNCQADGVPADITYQWEKGKNTVDTS